MAKMDLANNVAPINLVSPRSYTATVTPATGVDLFGYEGCTFIFSTGTITDGTWTVTFQESVTSNFAVPIPITDGDETKLVGDTPGPFTNVGMGFDDKIYKVGYIGTERYVRCIITETVMGTAEFGVSVVLGYPHSAPVATGFA